MLLIEPTMEYRRQIEAYREEFLSCGDSMDGTGALRRFERAADWLEHTNAGKHAETVPHGLVPATQYIFVREKDRKIVGMIQIRHYLNDYLKTVLANTRAGLPSANAGGSDCAKSYFRLYCR